MKEVELYHHGIKGQKWGVRRFQNLDGTLTALGRRLSGTASNAADRAKHQYRVVRDFSRSKSNDAANLARNAYRTARDFYTAKSNYDPSSIGTATRLSNGKHLVNTRSMSEMPIHPGSAGAMSVYKGDWKQMERRYGDPKTSFGSSYLTTKKPEERTGYEWNRGKSDATGALGSIGKKIRDDIDWSTAKRAYDPKVIGKAADRDFAEAHRVGYGRMAADTRSRYGQETKAFTRGHPFSTSDAFLESAKKTATDDRFKDVRANGSIFEGSRIRKRLDAYDDEKSGFQNAVDMTRSAAKDRIGAAVKYAGQTRDNLARSALDAADRARDQQKMARDFSKVKSNYDPTAIGDAFRNSRTTTKDMLSIARGRMVSDADQRHGTDWYGKSKAMGGDRGTMYKQRGDSTEWAKDHMADKADKIGPASRAAYMSSTRSQIDAERASSRLTATQAAHKVASIATHRVSSYATTARVAAGKAFTSHLDKRISAARLNSDDFWNFYN